MSGTKKITAIRNAENHIRSWRKTRLFLLFSSLCPVAYWLMTGVPFDFIINSILWSVPGYMWVSVQGILIWIALLQEFKGKLFLISVGYKPVLKPPFSQINNITNFIFTKKFYERVILPVISDSEIEYFEALETGRQWQAMWFKVLGYMMILLTMAREIFAAIKDLLFGVSKITK